MLCAFPHVSGCISIIIGDILAALTREYDGHLYSHR